MYIMFDDQSSIESTRFSTKKVDYKKQLIINCMPIPKELIDIIKGFCFYDNKSILMSKIEKFIKFKKKRIVMMFRDFTISRFRPGIIEDGGIVFDDESEYWTILNHTHKTIEFTLEATNCRCCGNYKNTSRNFEELSKIIKCNCVR
jgi:hypothetical protein